MNRFTWLALVFAALLTACSADRAHSVAVAPSAHDQVEAIMAAVDQLNAGTAPGTWTVRLVDSEAERDGEVVIRSSGVLSDRQGGFARCTPDGCVIELQPGMPDYVVAHELGHAAGLKHTKTHIDGNLMNATGSTPDWWLSEEQWEVIR